MDEQELLARVTKLETLTDLRRFENRNRKFNMNNVNTPVWGDDLYCAIQSLTEYLKEAIQNKQIDPELANHYLFRLRRL
jgi:hypothetical protein